MSKQNFDLYIKALTIAFMKRNNNLETSDEHRLQKLKVDTTS